MAQQSKLNKGLANSKDNYEFAELSPQAVEELNQTQKELSRDGKEIILLAYEKKD